MSRSDLANTRIRANRGLVMVATGQLYAAGRQGMLSTVVLKGGSDASTATIRSTDSMGTVLAVLTAGPGRTRRSGGFRFTDGLHITITGTDAIFQATGSPGYDPDVLADTVSPQPPAGLESGEFNGTVFFTDFSEYEAGAGLPTGISEVFVDGATARTYAIAESANAGTDATPGKYLQITRASSGSRWGIAFDAIGEASPFGEILFRQYTNLGASDGSEGSLGLVNNDNHARGGMRTAGVTYQLHLQARVGGSNIVDTNAAAPAGEQNQWVWTRLRVDDLGSGNVRYRVKQWAGAIGDEPGSFELDSGSVAASPADGEVGFRLESDTIVHDIAYFAYSNDPDGTPPPVPA